MSKIIDSIKFGLLPPDEIRKLSAVEIQTSDTYDEDGAPIESEAYGICVFRPSNDLYNY